MTEDEEPAETTRHHRRFEVLRKAHKVRDFWLELSVTVSGCTGEHCLRMLEEELAGERAKRRFDRFFPEPSVSYEPNRFQTSG